MSTMNPVTKPKRKVGAPKGSGSKYTEALAQEICERISRGEPLTQICRDSHMPQRSNVHCWRAEHEGFAGRFARARECGFDAIAAECMRIADDKMGDPDPSSRRVRVETRLKLLAKWNPKTYGERQG